LRDVWATGEREKKIRKGEATQRKGKESKSDEARREPRQVDKKWEGILQSEQTESFLLCNGSVLEGQVGNGDTERESER